jgi:hypothetical protein
LACDASTPPSPIDGVVAVETEVPARPTEVDVLVAGENNRGFVEPNPNNPPPDVDVVVPPKVNPVL